MMILRAIRESDIDELRRIHEKDYNELEFPNFYNFMCAFVVCDNQDNIVSGGGIRLIPEVIMMTDKSYPIKGRVVALRQALNACEFIVKSEGFNRFYVVTKDTKWSKHLEKVGFHSRGSMLVLDL